MLDDQTSAHSRYTVVIIPFSGIYTVKLENLLPPHKIYDPIIYNALQKYNCNF